MSYEQSHIQTVHNDWLLDEEERWQHSTTDDAVDSLWKLFPSNTNLMNYYYFVGAFGHQEIADVLALVTPSNFIQGNVTTAIDPSYRRSNIQWIKRNKDSYFAYRMLMFYVIKANGCMWNFNITNAFEHIQYAEYHAGDHGFYDWHVDLGTSSISACRKLSVIVQLSDPSEYDGGELCLKPSRNELVCPKEKGTIIIFPSYVLHTVKPVTRGVRKSLVIWIHGPPLK